MSSKNSLLAIQALKQFSSISFAGASIAGFAWHNLNFILSYKDC
jgi:hypothetical protein